MGKVLVAFVCAACAFELTRAWQFRAAVRRIGCVSSYLIFFRILAKIGLFGTGTSVVCVTCSILLASSRSSFHGGFGLYRLAELHYSFDNTKTSKNTIAISSRA